MKIINLSRRGGLARRVILINIITVLFVFAVFTFAYAIQARRAGKMALRARADREAAMLARQLAEIINNNYDDGGRNAARKLLDDHVKETRKFGERAGAGKSVNGSPPIYIAAYVILKNGHYEKIAESGDKTTRLFNTLYNMDKSNSSADIAVFLTEDILDKYKLVIGSADARTIISTMSPKKISEPNAEEAEASELLTGTASENLSDTAGEALVGKLDIVFSQSAISVIYNKALIYGFLPASAAMLVSMFLAAFLVRSLLKNVQPIIASAEKIAEGEMRIPPLDTSADNELGELAESFNRMVLGLRSIVNEIGAIADGDLTRIRSAELPGQLGEALRTMGVDLEEMVGSIKTISSQVAGASEEIRLIIQRAATDVQKQAEDAGDMAQSAETLAAAVSEIAQNSRMIDGNAQSVMKASQDAMQAAQEGSHVVEEDVLKLQDIEEAVQRGSSGIEELGRESKKISAVVDMISEVAESSNLLALNAAIEAARAGEYGKGFVVVADNVRRLAEKTTEMTRNISDMISNIQFRVEQVVKDMRRWKTDVTEGVELGQRTNEVLGNITERNRDLQGKVQEISTAIEEQTRATDEMSGSLAGISATLEKSADVARELAVGTEQIQVSVNDLTIQAEKLVRSVERFRT